MKSFFTFILDVCFGSKKTWSATNKKKKRKKNKVIYPNPSRAIKLVWDRSRGEKTFFGGGRLYALWYPLVCRQISRFRQSICASCAWEHTQTVCSLHQTQPKERLKCWCGAVHANNIHICICISLHGCMAYRCFGCWARIALYSRWIHRGFRGDRQVLDYEKCV